MSSLTLADVLRDRADHIVALFVAEVSAQSLSPQGLTRSLLANQIPALLAEIAAELGSDAAFSFGQDATDQSHTGRAHGTQRRSLGFDLASMIREYGVLRHAILRTAKEAGATIGIDEFNVLAKVLSVTVSDAVAEYVRERDALARRERQSLEFLASAGELLASSLDYRRTLAHLSGLIVPRMADWCAIVLDDVPSQETPIAHVDSDKLAVLRELYRRFPVPRGNIGSLHVAAAGAAQLVKHTDRAFFERIAVSQEHVELLLSLETCSWLCVPLEIQQRTFGSLAIAYSCSGRHYTEADLVPAQDLARRAALAIDHARLYRLAIEERTRVEAAVRAKDEFLATVSHELRTPLNAIVGWTGLLRSDTLAPEKRVHAIDVIERNAKAQTQIVNDLLDLSTVADGTMRLAPALVEAALVVESAMGLLLPAAQAKAIDVRRHFEEAPLVLADAQRLQQALYHLLSNALKFTPAGGTVDVSVRGLKDAIEIVVADSGQGIAQEFLPHVFEVFRQADGSIRRYQGGLGIGLSLVKHIVDLHGGTVTAASPGLGQGSTFCVCLPLVPRALLDVPAPDASTGTPPTTAV